MSGMKKYKKKIVVVVAIFAALYICYLIGQHIVLPSRMLKSGFTDEEGRVVAYSILEHYNQFAFAGVEPMADVPGSQTMSLITLDENSNVDEKWYGNYIFMTPNVSMATKLKMKKGYDKLTFLYGIHPWIESNVSDGAFITVEIYEDENEEPIIRERFHADAENDMQKAEIDLSTLKGKNVTIGFSCDTGDSNNEDGDWILIQYPVID